MAAFDELYELVKSLLEGSDYSFTLTFERDRYSSETACELLISGPTRPGETKPERYGAWFENVEELTRNGPERMFEQIRGKVELFMKRSR